MPIIDRSQAIYAEIGRVLGIPDTMDWERITVTTQPGKLPKIVIEFDLRERFGSPRQRAASVKEG